MKLIPLTQNQFAQVNDDIYEYLNQWRWCVNKKDGLFYAIRTFGDPVTRSRKCFYMHRIIMDAKKGEIIDHKNRDGLDNRKENLRICSHAQNMMNRKSASSTGYLGVYFVKQKYSTYVYAHIKKDKKHIHLGCFNNVIDAARAYDEAAKKYHGEFANLNFKD